MILSYQTLNQFVDLKGVTPAIVSKTLNQLGLETAIVENYLSVSKQLLVAQVLKKTQHPQLTKLWVCLAKTQNASVTVICGANNFEVGDKVIFAPAGTVLSKQFKIKKRQFGEYTSAGMFCSWNELRINKKDEGIAILPTHAPVGADNALRYVGYEDCLFRVETPWQEKEWNSPWVLGQYLSQILNLEKRTTDWTNSHLTTSSEIGVDVETILEGRQPLENSQDINNVLEKAQINMVDDPFANLISCVSIESGVNLTQAGLVMKKISGSWKNDDWKIKLKLQYHPKEEASKKIPMLLVWQAYQKLKALMTNFINPIEINETSKLALPKKKIVIEKAHFSKVLGNHLSTEVIEQTFAKTDFVLENTSAQSWTFTIPNYRLIENANQIVSEFLRLRGCDVIKTQTLTNQPIQWKENREVTTITKLQNYLLNLGINEVKNWSFVVGKQASIAKQAKANIKVLPESKNWSLQTSLLDNLSTSGQSQENIFTINKVFFAKNGLAEERLHLGVIFNRTWIKDATREEQITCHYPFLVQILINICAICNVSSQYLSKETVVHQQNQTQVVQDLDPLISYRGYENIFYQDTWIGQIGVLAKTKTGNERFYLELDLNALLQYQTQPRVKSEKKHPGEMVYIDVSLQFEPAFTSKIHCLISPGKISECNHYQHWVQYLHNLDKTIEKVKLIKQYQNATLTFRIWKRTNTQNPTVAKQELLTKITKTINQLDNVKIV